MAEKKKPSPSGAELAQDALDPSKQEDVEAAIKQLSPDEARVFVHMLEISLKKRRLQLVGYIATLAAIVVGMMWALYMYGTREPGSFTAWVFLIPFASAGCVLYLFGRLARRIK